MIIYNINHNTGEFVSTGEADESPLEPGVWLIPADAVTEEPPKAGEREVPVYKDGKWELASDWRGYQYWDKDDGSAHIISEIGEKPPKGHLTEKPPLSASAVEDLRAVAYADPIKGSYRHYMEALRLTLTGGEKALIDESVSLGNAARAKIQEVFPYGS